MLLLSLTEAEAITGYNALNSASINLQSCRLSLQNEEAAEAIEQELKVIFNIQDKLRNVLEFGNQKGDTPHGK